jgi:hypothetical protein
MRQWTKMTELFNPVWRVEPRPDDEWLVLIVGNRDETHFTCEGSRRGYGKALWRTEAESLDGAKQMCEGWLATREVMDA